MPYKITIEKIDITTETQQSWGVVGETIFTQEEQGRMSLKEGQSYPVKHVYGYTPGSPVIVERKKEVYSALVDELKLTQVVMAIHGIIGL